MGLHMATRLGMLINVVPLSSYMGLGILFNYVSEARKLAHYYYWSMRKDLYSLKNNKIIANLQKTARLQKWMNLDASIIASLQVFITFLTFIFGICIVFKPGLKIAVDFICHTANSANVSNTLRAKTTRFKGGKDLKIEQPAESALSIYHHNQMKSLHPPCWTITLMIHTEAP